MTQVGGGRSSRNKLETADRGSAEGKTTASLAWEPNCPLVQLKLQQPPRTLPNNPLLRPSCRRPHPPRAPQYRCPPVRRQAVMQTVTAYPGTGSLAPCRHLVRQSFLHPLPAPSLVSSFYLPATSLHASSQVLRCTPARQSLSCLALAADERPAAKGT